jgi:hypothetical protein
MSITLSEALAVLLYMQTRDVFITDEQKIQDMAWGIVKAEAERIIREASAIK